MWYHNPNRVSNILSQSWHVNFASIDTTSVLHLLIYPISYISAAAPAARPRSSCATSLGLPKYFYIKILKYIPCINKYLVTWLTMSSVPARRGSTQCWGAWRAPGAGTRSCRGCRGTNLNTLTLLHSHSHSKTLTISQIGYLHITHYTLLSWVSKYNNGQPTLTTLQWRVSQLDIFRSDRISSV